MQTHPNAHARPLEGGLTCEGRACRVARTREGDEERVALCIDLDSVVFREDLSQRAPVLLESVRIRISELGEQPGRALDVGEKERDGACREIGHARSLQNS
jgi:hypothetical protein